MTKFCNLKIYRIFQNENFWNFKNCKLLEFSKLKIYGISEWKLLKFLKLQFFSIFLIESFWQCPSWGIQKSFGIVHSFDIFHYMKFCQFLYLPFDINQFSQFLFPTLVTRKFYIWTFINFQIRNVSHSKILLFEILTITLFEVYDNDFEFR